MKAAAAIACLMAVGALTSGCTSIADVMRPGPDEQSQPQAQVAQDLSMPPDLQLHPPGTMPPPPVTQLDTTAPAAAQLAAAPATPATPYGAAPAAPQGDVYERNGISKFRADGTPKSDEELKAELKKVYLAKKQQKNPKYGTVFNIGNIFKDE